MSEPTTSTPADVPSVRDQQYVVACDQDGCTRKARGTLPEIVEHGWVMHDGAQHGSDKRAIWFCPGCVLGVRAV